MYGVEASQQVVALFTERNWMLVIADELVNRLLGAVCLTVSLFAGVLCAIVALLVHNDVTFCIVAGLLVHCVFCVVDVECSMWNTEAHSQ